MADEIACDCPSTEIDGPGSRIAVTGCVDRADHEHQPGRLCPSIGVLTNLRRRDRVELGLELASDHEQRRQPLAEHGVLRAESFSCSLKKVGCFPSSVPLKVQRVRVRNHDLGPARRIVNLVEGLT